MTTKIASEVISLIEAYQKPINIMKGLPFKEIDRIRTIEFYSNSKYLGGQTDELGRIKPFMNIVNGICDVENAAVDIDTKDIQVTADNKNDYVISFLLSKDIYEWMKTANFGKTLNDMRDTHTRYGSLLVKKCIYINEEGGKKKTTLTIEVPEWKNVISSQTDKLNSPIIEIHFKSASQIAEMTEWKNTTELINSMLKSGMSTQAKIYEMRGKFPVSYYKEVVNSYKNADEKEPITDDDNKEFTYQLYYFASGLTADDVDNDGKFTGSLTPVYWENNTEQVYKYKARKPKSGRAFGVGVIEEGEEAQVQTNNAVLKQTRAMEYTSKVVGQSASKKLKGRNLLNEVVDGQILETEENKPITALELMPSGGLTQYSNLIAQWYLQFQRATSAFDAQRGEDPPSNQPFRTTATVLQQSSSVFQDIQEELGIFYTEIFNDWVLPYLATQLNKEHILAHNFSVEELQWMDENYSINESNKKLIDMILEGKDVTPEMQAGLKQLHLDGIKKTQGTRFIDILKDEYKNLKPKVTVNITGEQRNKAATMESLNNIITLLSANPNATRDPFLMQLTTRILELSGAGISPVALLSSIQQSAKQQMENPVDPTAIPSSLKSATLGVKASQANASVK